MEAKTSAGDTIGPGGRGSLHGTKRREAAVAQGIRVACYERQSERPGR